MSRRLILLLMVVWLAAGCHVHVHFPPVQFGGGKTSATATTRPAADDPAFESVIEEMLE